MGNVKDFVRAYVDAALWSSSDESDDSGGEPLDRNYGPDDIAPATQRQMIFDAVSFYRAHVMHFDNASQAGHDFWLTRNRHGAGFWDGDYPEPQATMLTKAAQAYGEYGLYVGDDGQIHGSGPRGRPTRRTSRDRSMVARRRVVKRPALRRTRR